MKIKKAQKIIITICLLKITVDETNSHRNSDDSSGDHSYTGYYYYHSSATTLNVISTSKQTASGEREVVFHNMRTQTPQSFFFPLSFVASLKLSLSFRFAFPIS
ncbi:hypothetical protein Bca4012_051534 [Brassica carinata]